MGWKWHLFFFLLRVNCKISNGRCNVNLRVWVWVLDMCPDVTFTLSRKESCISMMVQWWWTWTSNLFPWAGDLMLHSVSFDNYYVMNYRCWSCACDHAADSSLCMLLLCWVAIHVLSWNNDLITVVFQQWLHVYIFLRVAVWHLKQ